MSLGWVPQPLARRVHRRFCERQERGTQEMTAITTGMLEVPGAGLYYKIQGSGPVLLILQGGDGSADTSDALAGRLAGYTVISYDRRGLSRSHLHERPQELSLQTHSDDAHRLLEALATGPAFAFGASIGALIGLDLCACHPGQVRMLVAHEPPAPQLMPDAERALFIGAQEDAEETFRTEGVAAAMRKFLAIGGVDPSDREADVTLPPPGGDRAGNLEFFLTFDAPAVRRYRLDIAALRAAPTMIVPAAGRTSRHTPHAGPAEALAGLLGTPLAEFPGGHAGYIFRPGEFAATLRQVLSAVALP